MELILVFPWQQSVVLYCWHLHIGHQKYKGNALLHFHNDSGYTDVPQCFIKHKLPSLFITVFTLMILKIVRKIFGYEWQIEYRGFFYNQELWFIQVYHYWNLQYYGRQEVYMRSMLHISNSNSPPLFLPLLASFLFYTTGQQAKVFSPVSLPTVFCF